MQKRKEKNEKLCKSMSNVTDFLPITTCLLQKKKKSASVFSGGERMNRTTGVWKDLKFSELKDLNGGDTYDRSDLFWWLLKILN